MGDQWFAKAETQGAKITSMLQKEGALPSSRTYENYRSVLTHIAGVFKENNQPSINQVTPEQATQYLVDRATEVGQSQLDMERQALQAVMQKINGNLGQKETLPVIKSELQTIKSSRAYTTEQVKIIAEHQQAHNALATEIAYAAGLRAHELFTIRPVNEQKPDERPAHEAKFEGREGKAYTVVGKGGLCREIRIPDALAARLEATRLPEPKQVTDRGVHYQQHYEIGAGQRWSNSFSSASNRSCGWSRGAHGLRHSYAQERMDELKYEHVREEALRIVSQELGHFRPEITEVYLR